MRSLNSLMYLICACFLFNLGHAQEPDPFDWTGPIIIPSSYYILWGKGSDEDSLNPHLGVFFNTPDQNVENLTNDSLNTTIGGNNKVYLEVVDLDQDGTDEIIGAWESPDSTVALHFMNANLKEKMPVDGKIIQRNDESRRIFIIPGNFDNDDRDEFVVAFIGADTTIQIHLFNEDDGEFVPTVQDVIYDEKLAGNSNGQFRFALVSGDFDNSGDDELALVSYDGDSDPEYGKGVYIKIYDVVNNEIIPKVKTTVLPETIITQSGFTLNEIVLAATSVPGYSTQTDRIAFAFTNKHNAGTGIPDTYLQSVKTNAALDSIISDDTKRISEYNNPNYLPAISLKSGDLDADGTAEVVFNLSSSFDIYLTGDDLGLTFLESGGFPSNSSSVNELDYSYDYLEMNNIDDIAGDEIVAIKNIFGSGDGSIFPQHFSVSVFGLTRDTLSTFDNKASAEELLEIPYEWPNRQYALALGNFNSSKVTIQEPTYFHRSAISKPVVVLNAPPVHFDRINGTNYDINDCYSGAPCDFVSTYNKVNSTSEEVSTQIKAAWDVSAGLKREGSVSAGASVEAAPLGVGGTVSATYSENFEYHLMAEYGEHFEETQTTEYSTTVELEVSAIEDDQIFATLTDFDIWEYPYTIGDEDEVDGTIVVFQPTGSEARWFPSKSISGYSYRPIHEVGNILSYYPYDSINDNPKVFDYVQTGGQSPTFTLSSTSDYNWSLTNTNFTSNSAQKEITSGIDAGFMGFGFAATFDATKSHLYTQTTTVSESINLAVHMGGIDRSIGPVEYRVTPYAYWSDEGALVIDYSVEPEVDQGGGATWWQTIYGDYPDPTMILPWRLDPEKGFGILDESKRQQTRDIIIRPIDISVGDSAKVTAYIRNFSLVNTPGNVKASFYVGDPNTNGELQSDVNGQTVFETDGPVPARGVKTISFTWLRPDTDVSYRMYMVIDPGDEIEEVHENNNIGWTRIENQSEPVVGIDPVIAPQGHADFTVNSVYPNPVNDMGHINYSVHQIEDLTLTLYSITGAKIKKIHVGTREPGNYTIRFDGRLLEQGMYTYSLEGASGKETGKFIVVY